MSVASGWLGLWEPLVSLGGGGPLAHLVSTASYVSAWSRVMGRCGQLAHALCVPNFEISGRARAAGRPHGRHTHRAPSSLADGAAPLDPLHRHSDRARAMPSDIASRDEVVEIFGVRGVLQTHRGTQPPTEAHVGGSPVPGGRRSTRMAKAR